MLGLALPTPKVIGDLAAVFMVSLFVEDLILDSDRYGMIASAIMVAWPFAIMTGFHLGTNPVSY